MTTNYDIYFSNLSNNGFGEQVQYIAGGTVTAFVEDLNKDGINDPMIGTNINNKIFLNDGKGAIFTNKINVPYPSLC